MQVKPILARLKTTLAGSAAALILSAGLLVGFVQAGTDSDGIYGEALDWAFSQEQHSIVCLLVPLWQHCSGSPASMFLALTCIKQ